MPTWEYILAFVDDDGTRVHIASRKTEREFADWRGVMRAVLEMCMSFDRRTWLEGDLAFQCKEAILASGGQA
ncbi:hypothetical protein DID96_03470 [Burkholderia sp. Bp8963]|uniref:hypothetical protein n=1 Tax=Burkholderia sp. Bp8963 TaxID=2184547 RepID=UPI000F5A834E|nr:hypothetical protein [Burkholderia sp. Bp8963]RQS75494.1 hypothetical protein DID96_03470 [Burkholderia sp. Bp8963]